MDLINQLYTDLKSKTTVLPANKEGWHLIILPFLGDDCKEIEIFVKQAGANILVLRAEDFGWFNNLGKLEDQAIVTTKDKFFNVVLELLIKG